jgi:catechol 2,3-dioxygenase-like lactoylglutathione lyase family enzyme
MTNPSISGLYEIAIGITAADESHVINYWDKFGFTVNLSGNLDAQAAKQLYGVDSNLRSLRLHNKVTDRSLLRLMIWDNPVNQGLELSPLKVVGSRWGTSLCLDVFNVANHAEDSQAAGLPIYYVPPQRNLINRPDNFQPFYQANPCVHEMLLIQPFTRQVIFQRHDYHRPNSGIVNPDSHFKASEFVHAGLIVDCEDETLDFYDQVLGLVRIVDNKESGYNAASRHLLDVKKDNPDEKMFNYYFIAPGYDLTEKNQIQSGNFEVLRFEGNLENKQSYSRPGCLGTSLYTLQVNDIDSYEQKVRDSEATEVTEIIVNEFGEKSFSFVAPDGYFWTLLQS